MSSPPDLLNVSKYSLSSVEKAPTKRYLSVGIEISKRNKNNNLKDRGGSQIKDNFINIY